MSEDSEIEDVDVLNVCVVLVWVCVWKRDRDREVQFVVNMFKCWRTFIERLRRIFFIQFRIPLTIIKRVMGMHYDLPWPPIILLENVGPDWYCFSLRRFGVVGVVPADEVCGCAMCIGWCKWCKWCTPCECEWGVLLICKWCWAWPTLAEATLAVLALEPEPDKNWPKPKRLLFLLRIGADIWRLYTFSVRLEINWKLALTCQIVCFFLFKRFLTDFWILSWWWYDASWSRHCSFIWPFCSKWSTQRFCHATGRIRLTECFTCFAYFRKKCIAARFRIL